MRSPRTLFRALAGMLTVAFTASAVPAVCALAQVECCEAEAVVEVSCCKEESSETTTTESVCACSDTILPATVAAELDHFASAIPDDRPWSHAGASPLVLDSISEAPRGHGPPPYLLTCRFLI